MAVEWYCQLMGSELGPFTTAQLVEMARKHQIEPIDMIKKGINGEWVAASRARGLFERAAQPAPEETDAETQPAKKNLLLHSPVAQASFRTRQSFRKNSNGTIWPPVTSTDR